MPVGSFTWPGLAPIPVPRVRAMRPFSLCWPVVSVALTSAGQGRGHGPHPELLGARLPEGRSRKRFRSAAALSVAPRGPAAQAEGPSWRQSWMQSHRKLLETRPACCTRGRGPLQHGVGPLEGRSGVLQLYVGRTFSPRSGPLQVACPSLSSAICGHGALSGGIVPWTRLRCPQRDSRSRVM